MKKRIVAIISIVIVIAIAIGLLIFFLTGKKENVDDNTIFSCSTVSEIEGYAEENAIGCENKGTVLHLYNAPVFDNTGYVVADCDSSGENIKRMTAYVSVDSNSNFNESINNIKSSLIEYLAHKEAVDFEYLPLLESESEANEDQFLKETASKVLSLSADGADWEIICNISGGILSIRITKTIV